MKYIQDEKTKRLTRKSSKGQVFQYNKGYAILTIWIRPPLMRSLNARARNYKFK